MRTPQLLPIKFYAEHLCSVFCYNRFVWLHNVMDKNKKVLLKIFDIDDELVEDAYIESDSDNNTVYIKLKRIILCCPN